VQHKAANLPDIQPPHPVALLVYDEVALFELGVACDIFGGEATTAAGIPPYQLAICGTGPSVSTDAGFRIEVPAPAGRAAHRADRGRAAHRAPRPPAAGRARRAARGPRPEDDLLTSAGSAASVDLCRHVVQRDCGTEIATQIARDLVVPLHREGGQAQYIDSPLPELDSSNLLADTVSWLQAHLDEEVSVNDLAARSAMSPRTFARRFLASTGTTPYQWIVRERIRLAQRLLETSDLPIDSVARKSGLRTASNLRKHFGRALRTTPQAYRRTFQPVP
jgi:AraC-like DNA-binding protein